MTQTLNLIAVSYVFLGWVWGLWMEIRWGQVEEDLIDRDYPEVKCLWPWLRPLCGVIMVLAGPCILPFHIIERLKGGGIEGYTDDPDAM